MHTITRRAESENLHSKLVPEYSRIAKERLPTAECVIVGATYAYSTHLYQSFLRTRGLRLVSLCQPKIEGLIQNNCIHRLSNPKFEFVSVVFRQAAGPRHVLHAGERGEYAAQHFSVRRH